MYGFPVQKYGRHSRGISLTLTGRFISWIKHCARTIIMRYVCASCDVRRRLLTLWTVEEEGEFFTFSWATMAKPEAKRRSHTTSKLKIFCLAVFCEHEWFSISLWAIFSPIISTVTLRVESQSCCSKHQRKQPDIVDVNILCISTGYSMYERCRVGQ